MCKQFQDASRSYEAGYDCAKYNNHATIKLTLDQYYDLACREADQLEETPPEPFAFRTGFEAFINENVK